MGARTWRRTGAGAGTRISIRLRIRIGRKNRICKSISIGKWLKWLKWIVYWRI